jgi:hypothetical protein
MFSYNWFHFHFFIHPTFQIPFYIFMGIFGVLMIVRPSTNSKKRMYEALLHTLIRKKSTYCAIDRQQE